MEYDMIDSEELKTISKEELAARYNDAVETIWIYQGKINELKTENDLLFDDYDHVSNLLYGS